MNKWEDIVRDKLGGYESVLPDGALAAFHARRSAIKSDSSRKRALVVWALISVTAIVATVLFPIRPLPTDDSLQIIEQPSVPPAAISAADSADVSDPVQPGELLVQATEPIIRQKVEETDTNTDEAADYTAKTQEVTVNDDASNLQISVIPDSESASLLNPNSKISSPCIPAVPESRTVGIRVGPVAGIVAGGGVMAGIAASGLLVVKDYNEERITDRDVCIRTNHYFPLKIGVSARVPISGNLNITTGIEYSLYTSKLTYSLTGDKYQKADYLSIPVRLDWSFASSNWLDVYVGAGIEGSYCLGATLDGAGIPKDGFGLTVLGTTGVQWKITRNLGLYFEPEISWTNPSFTNPLQTYRTEHPVVFSLTGGLRYTFDK